MGLVTLTKGQIVHKAMSDTVGTLEILVKGKIRATDQFTSFVINVGGIIGLVESPSKEYQYTYEALEDASVYTYPYEGTDDILAMLRCNEKITSVLASQSVFITHELFSEYERLFESALFEFKKVKSDYADYPELCIRAGEVPTKFEMLDLIVPPVKNNMLSSWEYGYYKSLKEHEAALGKSYYALSQDIAIGTIMIAEKNQKLISVSTKFLTAYKKQLSRNTSDFTTTLKMIHAKIENNEKATEGNENDPVITNALAVILTYSGVDSELSAKFQDEIAAFKASETRYDTADEARLLRKNISSSFYKIYKKVFLKSLSDKDIPIEVKMFLMFGFVDEELAGEKNTSILCNIARSYVPDPEGNILLLSEWLKKVYKLQADPSRNEFDQDWETYLREQKATGVLKQEQIDAMINNPDSRLDFEINNLFSLGNRMTFGRISVFVPVFDSMNVLKPLNLAYMTSSKIKEHISKIKSIDFGVFCRQAVYSNTDIGITQVYYAEEVEPYIILMPNAGTRATLWQEIEGKKRNTKGRMLISIFNLENTEDCMIKLLGEFRWEMCKTEQGVHWNDVTDPSLTSMYCDYLQFFKKNQTLSSEQKDKLRLDLKKYNNNYKSIFISDYLAYLKFEATGSLRLNKVAREILFNSCPFSRQYREVVYDNPQYKELINHYTAHNANVSKPLQNLEFRLKKEGLEVPHELTDQIEYLAK
ncbi:hypothetical protein [Butyrivibrio sp. M55]|uniref:hypothetical protein n=1 Tax=Butyrivibrio sp. M55 TaxID=1855323 RepID=UPI0008E21A10|nr:hypothetical protein [Butyrivibrio sp. M55]SFU36978.1 hypothetical protein SAMN05216540_101332 [Butyrivibrio sp. M55]